MVTVAHATATFAIAAPVAAAALTSQPTSSTSTKPRKNWEALSNKELEKEKDKSLQEDPNAGGDAALNGFFQQIYSGADEDTKRAMMKSFVESGGTALSTNWDEVRREQVPVRPPEGSEWKKWN